MGKDCIYQTGLDIGSTTAKIALINERHEIVFSRYARHNAKIFEVLKQFLASLLMEKGNCLLKIHLTGSAGLGLSQKLDLPFVQEVIATSEWVNHHYFQTGTVIDIGGEDSKMIFMAQGKPPDIRMNGSCAGGTGSFIDQMASLLNISILEFNTLAQNDTGIYSVASRCGVFAKTDVQNLLSRNVSPKDIAGSVFHAIAIQCINTLARGMKIQPKLLLCGGVFSFLPELAQAFLRVLNLSPCDRIIPDRPELIPAMGAALFSRRLTTCLEVRALMEKLDQARQGPARATNRMHPLFRDEQTRLQWEREKPWIQLKKTTLGDYSGTDCFLGIDSGSTTTKVVIIGQENEILFSWYANNQGDPIRTMIQGLLLFRQALSDQRTTPLEIRKSAVTGYGEELIQAALGIDLGLVETMAHFQAARHVQPHVSFVLDIGGQDMKAIFVDNGSISRVEINEACSSGCGSFVETFANSLGYGVGEFASLACSAEAPCDLGTRCTVFMNSKVKQSLRENATVGEISAGLAYSVVKNCLFKVLKLTDMADLGRNIVVQGGAFKNPSIVRALEMVSGAEVTCSDMPELMGAFGAALMSRDHHEVKVREPSSFAGLNHLEHLDQYQTRQRLCKGCENQCRITQFVFPGKTSFFSGNKCEKFYGSGTHPKSGPRTRGFNFPEFKNNLLFHRELAVHKDPVLNLGIPRCLGLYENFPFWHALFTHCGINLVLSGPSTLALCEKGMGTILSDSICFPAKLAHGHIIDLAEQKPDRIFYPLVVYEAKEFEAAINSYNCPIVSSYADVIHSAVNPAQEFGIPFDRPVVTFHDQGLLLKACRRYLLQFHIPEKVISKAFALALAAQAAYREEIYKKAGELIDRAGAENRLLVVLVGRPYHVDPLINHKIPEILAGLGPDLITEDALGEDALGFALEDSFRDIQVITQWAYPNRVYHAAAWAARQPDNVQVVQINSFGCGPDAVVVDETREILKTRGKNLCLIKVDEITSTGSAKLRLRSMVEALKSRKKNQEKSQAKRPGQPVCRPKPAVFGKEDRTRTILAPFFAEDYAPYLPALFANAGYEFEILPRPDKESMDLGLQYANNDICYPGILVIGDIVKALKVHDPEKIAIGITQTGGQCRATSYLSLIRKALVAAGFAHVPVISVTASSNLSLQPGFQVNWLRMIPMLYTATMFADCLAKMHCATAVREKTRGESQEIRNFYIQAALPHIRSNHCSGILDLLGKAVQDFNRVEVDQAVLPRVGIVGEIYVKYNGFANQNLIDWLMAQGVEPVLSPIIHYFTQDLVNYKENIQLHLRHWKISDLLGYPIKWFVNHTQNKINRIFSKFRHGTPFHDIRTIAQKAGRILSMSNQFGEGWIVAGEIACFAQEGVNHVLSLQPFGCIANHIVSKGVETRIKALYPDMNLLFLDYDAGMSEVNVLNRLHFMVENARRVRGSRFF